MKLLNFSFGAFGFLSCYFFPFLTGDYGGETGSGAYSLVFFPFLIFLSAASGYFYYSSFAGFAFGIFLI